MMGKNINILLHIVLLALFGLQVFIALRFASRDTLPMFWDYANHMHHALFYYHNFFQTHSLSALLNFDAYPPFMYWAFAFFIRILGYSRTTVIAFNLSLLFVLLCTVYLYTMSVSTKITACLTTLFALGISLFILQPYWFMKPFYDYMLDFPLMVTTYVAYTSILYSFQKHRFSLRSAAVIGVLTGIALMTKWTAATILFVPFIIYGFTAIKLRKYDVACTLLLSLTVSGGWWYILHFNDILRELWLRTHVAAYYSALPLSIYLHPPLVHYQILFLLILPVCLILFDFIRKNLKYLQVRRILLLKKSFVLEFSNVMLSAIFFIIFPAHDYRFLYATIFLFSMILFRNILHRTSSFQEYTLSVGVFLFTTLSILLFLPSISTDTFVLDHIRTYILTHNVRTYEFFLESSSPTLNMDNIYTLFTELSILQNRKHLSINAMNPFPNYFLCDQSYKAQIFFIYKYTKLDMKNRVDYPLSCPESYLKQYVYLTSEHASDGEIQIYAYKKY